MVAAQYHAKSGFVSSVIFSVPIGCMSGESRLGGEFGIINSSSAQLSDAALLVADSSWVAQTLSIAMMSGSVMCFAQIAGVKDNFVAIGVSIDGKVCLVSMLMLALVSGIFIVVMLGNLL